MALFFGGDLLGWLRTVPTKPFAERAVPWLHLTFALTAVTGVALFLYDPLHAGSRAYWTPKLIAIALGLANATLFNRTAYVAAVAREGQMPIPVRIAATLSVFLWSATLVFACLNTEAMPKVLLR